MLPANIYIIMLFMFSINIYIYHVSHVPHQYLYLSCYTHAPCQYLYLSCYLCFLPVSCYASSQPVLIFIILIMLLANINIYHVTYALSQYLYLSCYSFSRPVFISIISLLIPAMLLNFMIFSFFMDGSYRRCVCTYF